MKIRFCHFLTVSDHVNLQNTIISLKPIHFLIKFWIPQVRRKKNNLTLLRTLNNLCFPWWFCIEPDRYMRINFALILWRRMIEFPPALLALPKHQSMTICSPCSSTPPSSLHLPTTVRPNTLWTKILNESKKNSLSNSSDGFTNFMYYNESTNFSRNWACLFICM